MQQLTVAFGGEVYATDQPEIGFTFVEPRVPAIPRGPWMEYHYDACRLPPGAVALAANGHGLQAYRLGSALAVQFHPEVDRAVVKRWSVESADELEGLGLSAAWMVEDAEAHADDARARRPRPVRRVLVAPLSPAGAPTRGAACARRPVRRPAGGWPC